jgi:hypothetical protein
MIQKIYKEFPNMELVKKYYAILFLLNDIHVPEKELSLVAFSALNGSLTSPPIRNKFIVLFNSSEGSVYNMMASLQKKNILVKDEDRNKYCFQMRQIDMIRKECSKQLELSQKEIDDVLAFSYSSLLKAFHSGGKIELSGLGTFVLQQKKSAKLLMELEYWLDMYKAIDNERRVEDLENKIQMLKTIRNNEPAKEFIKHPKRDVHALHSKEEECLHSKDSEE